MRSLPPSPPATPSLSLDLDGGVMDGRLAMRVLGTGTSFHCIPV
jgi:hypothetical protein